MFEKGWDRPGIDRDSVGIDWDIWEIALFPLVLE